MSKQTVEIPIAQVVLDDTWYTRWRVDDVHVRRLKDALASGAVFPPVKVQKSTMRLIDGRHRVMATRLLYGDDAKITAIILDVSDEEAVKIALAENKAHGLPMRPIDLRHALMVAERYQLSDEDIVRSLNIPPGRLMDLRAMRGSFKRHGISFDEQVPLKGSMHHLAGQELTPAQYQVTRIAPGIHPTLLANQLSALIQAGALDRSNDRLRLALFHLREALIDIDLETPWGEHDARDEARGEALPAAG